MYTYIIMKLICMHTYEKLSYRVLSLPTEASFSRKKVLFSRFILKLYTFKDFK